MSRTSGLLLGAAQLGLQAIMVKPQRSIGGFEAHVTLEETHQDDIEITDHPVEVGASITDHSFKLPTTLVIKAGWSDSPTASNLIESLSNAVTGTISGVAGLASQAGFDMSSITGNGPKSVRDIYAELLALQASRVLIDVFTGKRAYKNMLIKSIVEKTDKDTENGMILTITLREVLLVSTQTLTLSQSVVSSDTSQLKDPEATSPTSNSGQKQLTPAPTAP